jgi:hypothetical protein
MAEAANTNTEVTPAQQAVAKSKYRIVRYASEHPLKFLGWGVAGFATIIAAQSILNANWEDLKDLVTVATVDTPTPTPVTPTSTGYPVTGTPEDDAAHDILGPSDEKDYWRLATPEEVAEKKLAALEAKLAAAEAKIAALEAKLAAAPTYGHGGMPYNMESDLPEPMDETARLNLASLSAAQEVNADIELPDDMRDGFNQFEGAGGEGQDEYERLINTRNGIWEDQYQMLHDMDELGNTSAEDLPDMDTRELPPSFQRAQTMMANIDLEKIPPLENETAADYLKRIGLV